MLPADLKLGPAQIAVADLDRAIGFYQRAIGLQLHCRDDATAAMGGGSDDVLLLREEPAARPAGRQAGLYHYCLLFASREELARAAIRIASTQTPIQGASDHGTHEAIYLSDVDGNGIELAADRPRELWPDMRTTEGYAGGPAPLDLDELLATIGGEQLPGRVEPDLSIGHIHLCVGDIAEAIAFYRDVVGLELMIDIGSAAFLSAGGYHHRLGTNVWRGRGVPPSSDEVVGLREWVLVLPRAEDVAAARTRLEAAGAPTTERQGGFQTRDPWNVPLAIIT